MINVTALTSGKNVPASRFRIRQFINPLKEFGVNVSEYYARPNKYLTKRLSVLGMLTRVPGLLAARSGDITWLERELIAGKATLERFAGTRRLLDVDDAIWLLNDSRFSERIASQCRGVIAGNQFIADHYRAHGAKAWIVPTSINTEVWKPAGGERRAKWTIGWIGTSSNLPYLEEIEEPLADFLAQVTDSQLLIVSNRKPTFRKIPEASWRFLRWTPEEEVRCVQEMDVGLMPLPDNEWARGKCAFKMLSYMAVRLPVIVTPVGVNQQILSEAEVGLPARTTNDWYQALNRLFHDRELASRLGVNGRRVVEEQYSVKRNVGLLAEIFREVMSS